MSTRQLINEQLFKQFEKEGREVLYTKRDDKKIKARIIDPIKKLYEKGFISYEESSAADQYSEDYELSMCVNYAQAFTNGMPSGTSEYCFEDKRLQASVRVNDIKILISHLANYRQRKLKRIITKISGEKLTSFERVLLYIFEHRLSIKRLENASGIHRDVITKKCQKIASVILNYYDN